MPIESWLPVGFRLPDGSQIRLARQEGRDWQIYETLTGDSALLARAALLNNWNQTAIIDAGIFQLFRFGDDELASLSSGRESTLSHISQCNVPSTFAEALAFAQSLKASRAIDAESSFADGIYVEKYSRILPTGEISPAESDSVVLGTWLTGVRIPIESTRRLHALLGWLPGEAVQKIVEAAGFDYTSNATVAHPQAAADKRATLGGFKLVGRPELEQFFNEHVIEIIENAEQYHKLGIDFPSAIILHGLPGCGKTFAVEKLVEYLDWPSYSIEASSVASPYIHETSRKVAEVFSTAIDNAPSVLVIDEMESFLTDREGAHHHRVEEVAEFLRRIPEAISKHVLVIAMTNRIEMIDTAITRRGRFDHIIEVKMASKEEVIELLKHLLKEIPCDSDLDVSVIAEHLAGRPMSDITFVVREAARMCAKAGKESIDQDALLKAVASAPQRGAEKDQARRIGFY